LPFILVISPWVYPKNSPFIATRRSPHAYAEYVKVSVFDAVPRVPVV